MEAATDYWPVKIKGDVIVCVEPMVQHMSSYVLLEQEDWFEDELEFIREYITPEMNVFDMGANHGVYALSIAKKLDTGRVWAFEPTMVPGSMLAKSIELNGFADKLVWVHAGLSDHEREADIFTSTDSELNSLHATTGIKEKIKLYSVDGFMQQHSVDVAIDFVKMDVEGEEINTLIGGHQFFTRQSPLVMFELTHGTGPNFNLIKSFQELGYQIYRLLPDLNILVEYDHSFQDEFLLNLFACKSQLADRLAQRGLLADGKALKALGKLSESAVPTAGLEKLAGLPFAQTIAADWQQHRTDSPEAYRAALSACMMAHDSSLPAAQRVHLIEAAYQWVENLILYSLKILPEFYLLKLHLLHLLGHRQGLDGVAKQAVSALGGQTHPMQIFFIPPSRLFFDRTPKRSLAEWVTTCVTEFAARRVAYSTFFLDPSATVQSLSTLHNNPDVSSQIERRIILCAVRAGIKFQIPESHPALTQSMNPDIWHQVVQSAAAWAIQQEFSSRLLTTADRVHILDVGASTHGLHTEPYATLMQIELAQVTGFEPNPLECQKLNDMYQDSKAYRYYPEFVGLGGAATFYETNWFMTSSLYKPNASVLSRFHELENVVQLVAQHAVNTVSIADLPDLPELDMIKIDVQGAELDVFKGAGQRLDDVLVIWTEVEFLPLYENQPLFSDVDQYLRQRGFMFHTFDGIAVRGHRSYAQQATSAKGMRQVLWSDAVFIRDLAHIGALPTSKLKKFAAIMDAVVHSFDVCHLILEIIDQRENSDLARQYLAHKTQT